MKEQSGFGAVIMAFILCAAITAIAMWIDHTSERGNFIRWAKHNIRRAR